MCLKSLPLLTHEEFSWQGLKGLVHNRKLLARVRSPSQQGLVKLQRGPVHNCKLANASQQGQGLVKLQKDPVHNCKLRLASSSQLEELQKDPVHSRMLKLLVKGRNLISQQRTAKST